MVNYDDNSSLLNAIIGLNVIIINPVPIIAFTCEETEIMDNIFTSTKV